LVRREIRFFAALKSDRVKQDAGDSRALHAGHAKHTGVSAGSIRTTRLTENGLPTNHNASVQISQPLIKWLINGE
jgi:hypothetical protein